MKTPRQALALAAALALIVLTAGFAFLGLAQRPAPNAAAPPALASDLTNAWQASIAADQAYAEWANDEIAKTCVPNDTTDPGYLATETPNTNATKYKTAFVAQWNPIAAQYGLTQYQQGQL